jgi:hypothetical protein
VKKNRLNRLEFLKNRPVRFLFYKPENKKTEPKPKKPSQTGKNRAETGWFESILVFYKKTGLVITFFLYKNRTEPKIITPNKNNQLHKSIH